MLVPVSSSLHQEPLLLVCSNPRLMEGRAKQVIGPSTFLIVLNASILWVEVAKSCKHSLRVVELAFFTLKKVSTLF